MIWLAVVVIVLGAFNILGNSIRAAFLQQVDRCERAAAYLLFVLGLILLTVAILVKP